MTIKEIAAALKSATKFFFQGFGEIIGFYKEANKHLAKPPAQLRAYRPRR